MPRVDSVAPRRVRHAPLSDRTTTGCGKSPAMSRSPTKDLGSNDLEAGLASPQSGSSGSIRVMALDWGERRIGIAVSDELGIAAHPLPTLNRTNIRNDLDTLAALIQQRGIDTVIVGLPLHIDGSPSRSSNLATRFAHRLAKHASVPVKLRDERLTSWQARGATAEWNRERGTTDRVAASILLEGYLDEVRP